MQRKLNTKGKILVIALSFVALIVLSFIIFLIVYFCNISPVSNNSDSKTFTIVEGETYYSIADDLKKANLIKSEFFYKIFIKLNHKDTLKSGTYELNETMSVNDILDKISTGGFKKGEMITFKEGLNMRQITSLIVEKTSNTKEDVEAVLKDTEYLDSLIKKYWFITDEIKNDKIYYSLEGYLFPDTYEFFVEEVTVKEIFNKMLDEMAKKLEPYKDKFANSKYTVHEILTLASIIELESRTVSDRAEVAGVFYNRLNLGWSLGSDVTTYYGAKVNMSDRDLYQREIDEVNAYNTRSASMAGKLPVSPICNPSLSSITAALTPTNTNYYYFVADKNGKTYFTKTYGEHLAVTARLQREGLWYTY